MQECQSDGVMISIEATEEEVRSELAVYEGLLDIAGLKAWQRAQAAARLRAALEALPSEAHHALRVVRERVEQDRLPLFSLLEAAPLQVQSSHLSFQEFFCARAICARTRLLPAESAG